jgi:hypothetical protein
VPARGQGSQSDPAEGDEDEHGDVEEVGADVGSLVTTDVPYQRPRHHPDQRQRRRDGQIGAHPGEGREDEPQPAEDLDGTQDGVEGVVELVHPGEKFRQTVRHREMEDADPDEVEPEHPLQHP